MEASSVLGVQRLHPVHATVHVGDVITLTYGIGNRTATIAAAKIDAVADWPAPIGVFFDAIQAVLDAKKTTHVASIAVGVQAGCVCNHE